MHDHRKARRLESLYRVLKDRQLIPAVHLPRDRLIDRLKPQLDPDRLALIKPRKHIDHLMGIIWMVRMICQFMRHGEYQGEATIYSHREVLDLIRDMAQQLLPEKQSRFIGDRLHLQEVHDGETKRIIGHDVTFFDIQSTKAKQYGFCMDLGDGKKLTCCGDEPYDACEEMYAKNSEWLLHEAFCLYAQRDIFDPYEKHHSTVKDACQLAEKLNVRNLLLYHTEDQNLNQRKRLYAEEGAQYYHGRLLIPDDLESYEL